MLSAGTRVGPYEIVQLAGAGGMGQVFRARDTRLNRDVAIKILPDMSGHDPDTVARFRREAQTLASLNHPNIAAVHGLEEAGEVVGLVMEFVEGRPLTQIIASSRAAQDGSGTDVLALPEAIDIARQIALALEAAHESGIVHRDLKPGNIMVRDDGTVMVLDFGLAKVLGRGDTLHEQVGVDDHSPTVTSPAFTGLGVILGTAAYMSPEQARGKPVDKRADIWAFGVVLYEMVTGRRLFGGDSLTDVLAAVVKDTPDLSAAPPSVRRLLETCLEKDPRKRLRDISGAALLLEESQPGAPVAPVSASDAPAPVSRWAPRTLALLGGGIVLAAVAVMTGAMLLRRDEPPPLPAIEFSLDAPPGTTFGHGESSAGIGEWRQRADLGGRRSRSVLSARGPEGVTSSDDGRVADLLTATEGQQAARAGLG